MRRLMAWLINAASISGGTSENWCVISNTIRMLVTGARTTAPSVALMLTMVSMATPSGDNRKNRLE